MKEGLRAIPVLIAALAAGSCAWFGGAPAREPAADAAELPDMRRIPPWIRPSAAELASSADLRAAVVLVEQGEFLAAAVLLQRARVATSFGPEPAALHAWSLSEAGSTAESEQVARAALAEFGPEPPSLHYALAVACELRGKPEPAYQSYLRVLLGHPEDPVLLRACARTALASGQPGAALTFHDRLALLGPLELADQRARAEALTAAQEFDGALSVYEAMVRDHPADALLLAEAATAAYELARDSQLAEHRRRAGVLLVQLTEADPQHAAAFRMLGANCAGAGDLPGAEAALRRALEIEPAQCEAGLQLAQVLVGRNQPAAARRVLQDLLRQPLAREEVDEVRARLLELGPE